MRRCFSLFILAASLAAGVAQTPAPAAAPRKSPVDSFRELLVLPEAERARALAGHPERFRRTLEAKLAEYDALSAEERELRLRATQLRWYLLPLMRMPVAVRADRLAAIPAEDRKLVGVRLAEWDKLPADLQRDMLANENTLLYLLRGDVQAARTRETLSAELRRKLESEMTAWRTLPAERQQTMLKHFSRFCELDEREKARTLNTLSAAERQQMEKTLQDFERLPLAQRALCLRSFEKFSSLSTEEQFQFLKDAEHWREMKPGERAAWRELVSQLPPSPPGLGEAVVPANVPPLTQTTNR